MRLSPFSILTDGAVKGISTTFSTATYFSAIHTNHRAAITAFVCSLIYFLKHSVTKTKATDFGFKV